MKKENRNKNIEYRSATRPILKYLNSLPNSKAINIHGSVYTERGTPDIIGCIKDKFIAIECKRSKEEKPEKIQSWRLEEWKNAGAIVGVASNVEDVKLILKDHNLI